MLNAELEVIVIHQCNQILKKNKTYFIMCLDIRP